jgi:hypothetical protein
MEPIIAESHRGRLLEVQLHGIGRHLELGSQRLSRPPSHSVTVQEEQQVETLDRADLVGQEASDGLWNCGVRHVSSVAMPEVELYKKEGGLEAAYPARGEKARGRGPLLAIADGDQAGAVKQS